MTCLLAGLLTLACVWLGPLPRLANTSFAAHMTMHMAVVAVAAPLLSLGLSNTRFDPARSFSRFFSPIAASIAELLVVWAFHAPALHHAARHLVAMRMIEQAAFLASGLWLWLSIFGGEPQERAARTGTGVLALLLTSMHMTLLGALLALPTRSLYHHHGAWPGLSPLEDQQLGGAIMLLVGGIVYLGGGLWLAAKLLRPTWSASSQRGST